MSQSVGTLRNVSSAIGSELDEQAVMLDEFGAEIEQAETKLDATMRKMVRVFVSLAVHSEKTAEIYTVEKGKIYSHRNFFPSNELFSDDLFSICVAFTKFLPKKA